MKDYTNLLVNGMTLLILEAATLRPLVTTSSQHINQNTLECGYIYVSVSVDTDIRFGSALNDNYLKITFSVSFLVPAIILCPMSMVMVFCNMESR